MNVKYWKQPSLLPAMKSLFVTSSLSVLMCSMLIPDLGRAQPSVTEMWPASQSKDVCADTPLRLMFSEPMVLGSKGRIAVYRASDHKLADALDVGDAWSTNRVGPKTLHYQAIQVESNVALVELHSHTLNPSVTYCVNIDPGVFKNASGLEFAGFTNDSSWQFSTRAALARGRTNLVVAADGTGDFCTPQGAVDYVQDDNQAPVSIFVRRGVYDGLIYIASEKGHLHFIGEDRHGSIITGRNNDRQNSGRIGRALLGVDADDFTLENLTLRNTTPYHGSQAEALRVNGRRCILRNDDFYSFQDTLMLSGSVYLTNCYVEGDVDFIWGQGSVFFDQCEIKAVHDGYYLQSRNPAQNDGYVFYQCKLTAAPAVKKCWLARIEADRFPFSAAAFIQCQMGPHVPPAGWEVKGTNAARLRFAEFQSADAQGKPVDVSQRLPASHQLTASEAAELSDPAKVLSYHDTWNPRLPGAAVGK
jgi:pectin methylesterase-like acyl-CoA thioesterase